MSTTADMDPAATQRRRVRRTTLLLFGVAFGFYTLFIVFAVLHAHR